MLLYVRQRLLIKPFMIGYLALLLLLSSLIFEIYDSLWQGVVIVVLYAMFDVVWTYTRDRVWYIPFSSIISGLIMALVGTSLGSAWGLAAVPFVAVFSKQVIRFGVLRHIFNPAAFSLVFFSFLGALHPAFNVFAPTWWAPSLASPFIFTLILFAGSFIIFRLQRWHIVLPFFVVYSVFWLILFLFYPSIGGGISEVLRQHLLDNTLIFFVAVMLIEPVTSSFPLHRQRVFYGASVAVFAGIFTYGISTAAGAWFSWLDPLIGGLLLGNLIAGIFFLPRRVVV